MYRYNQWLGIAAPAKLNLFLELLNKRDDGFHELETVMCKIALSDHLFVAATEAEQIVIKTSTHPSLGSIDIPSGQANLVVRALSMMRDLADKKVGAKIELRKNIPVEAGLGGASSDAAAALLAGNQIWGLNWSLCELMDIAGQIGSDVAFFLGGSWARCTGKGEQVHNLNYPCRLNIVIAKPNRGLSTSAIYARCVVPDHPIATNTILSGLRSGQASRIGNALHNRLEQFAENDCNEIARLRTEFDRTNSVGHQLTGSGSCYFGIYKNGKAMKTAARQLKSRLPETQIYTSHTLSSRHVSLVA